MRGPFLYLLATGLYRQPLFGRFGNDIALIDP